MWHSAKSSQDTTETSGRYREAEFGRGDRPGDGHHVVVVDQGSRGSADLQDPAVTAAPSASE
jgi:hypothetical protein